MAKLSADGKYVTVQYGDTLSEITLKYMGSGSYSTYTAVAAANGIQNPNLIYAGQIIYLTKTKPSSSSGSTSKTSNELKITAFGPSAADTKQKTLFATWTCKLPEIDKYKYEWHYTTGDKASGSDVWFKGNSGELEPEETNCTYTIPDGAKKVRFRVKPLPTEIQVQTETSKSSSSKSTSSWKDKLGSIGKTFSLTTDKVTGVQTAKSFTDRSWVTKTYNVTPAPPETPSNITAEIDPKTQQLNVEISGYPVQTVLDANVDEITSAGVLKNTKIEIQVVANGTTQVVSKSGVAITRDGSASWTYSQIKAGNEYTVRCRAVRGSYESEWSAYTNSVCSAPAQVKITKTEPIKSPITGQIDFYLEWGVSKTAETYTIQYLGVDPGVTPKFDGTNDANIKTQTIEDPQIVNNRVNFTITNVDTGKIYYFRVAAVNSEAGTSEWSTVAGGVAIGEPPGRPTTWSSAESVGLGEDLYIYWVHNPKDGSRETSANIYIESFKTTDNEQVVVGIEDVNVYRYETSAEITADLYKVVSGKKELVWSGRTSVSIDKDQTSYYKYETSNLTRKPWLEEGVTLRYSIRTAGIVGMGNDPDKHWSDPREIKVYAQPELTFTVKPHGSNVAYNSDFTCSSFPLTINASSGPKSQSPTGYYISIVSNDTYETVDNVGRNKIVSVGDVIYSKYFDVNGYRDIENFNIGPSDVNLDNGMNYTIECVVSMNSGLSVQRSINFEVEWVDDRYSPLAQVIYDPEAFITTIRPYCESYTTNYFKVRKSGLQYLTTTEKLNDSWGQPLRLSNGKVARTSDTNDVVYTGVTTDSDGNYLEEEVLFYEVNIGSLMSGVTLSVYRREYDGHFTEIATGISNTKNTFVTDPHPALDYARYRIVATSDDTGAVSYTDIPGVPIGEPGIILQWDEEWSSFDINPDTTDGLSQPNWAGSLLRLPYNVDVSPSYGIDTTLIEYIGREHPVSYYGTQLGETATWNTVIPKEDKETIYALHRLAKWPGNVYAREPSGVGYWAHVTVQFPQKHLDKTVPVTISLTRVEGGM